VITIKAGRYAGETATIIAPERREVPGLVLASLTDGRTVLVRTENI
jgi:hypothetical protein